ncbi:MAG: ABC transporter permease [Bacillota bacterium]|nr:ABC transporter permease [Bacillota bacterium]
MVRHKISPTLLIGTVICAGLILAAVFGPLLTPYDPLVGELRARLSPPSVLHPMGTDSLGRDILSRILSGGRLTLLMGFSSVLLAAAIGTTCGLAAAYFGGWTDTAIMRINDILLALPGMFLAIAVVAILGTGLEKAMVAVAIHRIPAFARITRASALSIMSMPYVESAKAMGSRNLRIVLRHVLPNMLNPIVVLSTISLGTCILTLSSLGFLGLGAQPPDPEWGVMLSEARILLRVAPHTAMFPGLAVGIAVLGFNLIGDGLRDILDPRLRRSIH